MNELNQLKLSLGQLNHFASTSYACRFFTANLHFLVPPPRDRERGTP